MAEPKGPVRKVRVMRVSGYVLGPCSSCGKEGRGIVMFDDYGMGVECFACKAVERVDEVEYVPEGNIEY